MLRRVLAERSGMAGKPLVLNEGTSSVVLGEFEGHFDPSTRGFSIQPRAIRSGNPSGETGGGGQFFSRSTPGSEVLPGASGFGFSVINSAFINSGDNPGTVTGEIQLTNNTSATMYNVRLVFTSFKIQSKDGPVADNMPGASGFAFFNDGQVPYGGKLNVSRAYGDIGAGGSARRIWTFATIAQPPGFFFAYRVLADVGVAVESVEPAAMQVIANTGSSLQINGRGFTGTPTVELLPANGNPIALTNVVLNGNQLTANVPAGTAAGIYGVRVTNPGSTPGGYGSSTLANRLTITGAPDGGHTLSGEISALNDTGPYLISGSATISAGLTVLPGTVFYVAKNAMLTINGAGNLIANGGVPGVNGGAGILNPAQIVFTAQRSPGAALPASGSWGGIIATSPSVAEMVMRNVVVEYGGALSFPQISISGSGRKLRFTDSISRRSAGSGIVAGGPNDLLLGFARNRIEANGFGTGEAAVLLSANAALGLYELSGGSVPAATSVGDASFYYSSANDFAGNQIDAVQIGTDADAGSNDFTKSGVLVGQGDTPIRIRGNCDNPAIVGAAPPAPPAELTINAGALIHLAPGVDLKVADYASNRIGCMAANGYAGFYQGNQSATSNDFIDFDKIPGVGNFGAIFFSRNAMSNCVLNFVRVQNGGGSCSAGSGEVVVEGLALKITNSQINNSSSGGLLETLGASVNTTGTTFSNNTPIIDTVAGGILGDGNLGNKAILITPVAVAVDPLGRGIFLIDAPSGVAYLRFLNTTRNQVTLAGRKITAGTLVNIAGGGVDYGENVPGALADVGNVTGIAVSPNGELVYFIDALFPAIRAVNISNAVKSISGANILAGSVGTFIAQGFENGINGLAVNPSNGDVYVADATPNVYKVFKVPANIPNSTTNPTIVAGNGASTKAEDPFVSGSATSTPLLQPRAVTLDNANNVYIADTGHGRVIKVDTLGNASLVAQFPAKSGGGGGPYSINPFTSGLAFFNGKLYLANGNSQDIPRIDAPGAPPTQTQIAGTIGKSCDYTNSNCGDGGPAKFAEFSLVSGTGSIPLVAIAADANGIYVPDQGTQQHGRIRYINLSANTVEIAGVSIAPGNIDTVAGTGLEPPFDGALATSSAISSPTGVATDQNGNLWITDTLGAKLRFVNRGTTSVKIFENQPSEQLVAPGTIVTVNYDSGSGPVDGVPASQAGFDTPQGLTVTSKGVFIADSRKGPATLGSNGRRTGLLRFINTTSQDVIFYANSSNSLTVPAGNIAIVAGGNTDASLTNVGDGSNPLLAKFIGPSDVVVAANGDMYVADAGQRRVRKITFTTGVISSLNLPSSAPNEYTGLAFDSTGRLLVANAGNQQILREKSPGTGNFDVIFSGLPLNKPRDVVEAKNGNLFVTNAGDPGSPGAEDNRIVKIVLSGNVGSASILAGSVSSGYAGDGGAAANALLNITTQPINVATISSAVLVRTTVNIIVTQTGEIIFTDSVNNAVRRIR